MTADPPQAGVADTAPDRVERRLVIARKTAIADAVIQLELIDPHGNALPPWEPGAHVEVRLPSGLLRQYSLCGDRAQLHRYSIAVLRETAGRGGSAEIHDSLEAGAEVSVVGPRNTFALLDAASYLLVGGGIGITPLVSMARELAARGADWSCLYGGRSIGAMAYRDELLEIGADRVTIVAQNERGLPDLGGALRAQPPGCAVYCCGPEPMIERVERLCARMRGRVALHTERFGELVRPAVGHPGDVAFEVELARRGEVVRVGAHQTVLDAVHTAVPEYPYSCRQGYCGTCRTRLLAGAVEHRDTYLTDAEKAANQLMMICVSRASAGERIVLDV